MRVLKRSSKIVILSFVALLFSCSTSYYRVTDRSKFRAEIEVTPDRILLECEDIIDHENAGDPEGNFGFMIHVLDDEDTVLTLIQEPVIGRKDCFERQEDIAKILRNGKCIYIGGHGTLDDPRVIGKRIYSSFPKKGIFRSNGRSLQLSVIKNENGRCYSAENGTDEPCMPAEFPIKKWPNK